MINTSKAPISTARPSFQASTSRSRSITQRPRLARLGNPRDSGGPAPKRLTWPDHGDRNTGLGTLRRTRTTGANLPNLPNRPIPLASAPRIAANILAPTISPPGSSCQFWQPRGVRAKSRGGADRKPAPTPDFFTPRYLSRWRSSITYRNIVSGTEEAFSSREDDHGAEAETQAGAKADSRGTRVRVERAQCLALECEESRGKGSSARLLFSGLKQPKKQVQEGPRWIKREGWELYLGEVWSTASAASRRSKADASSKQQAASIDGWLSATNPNARDAT